ncbi:MAG: alpha/beta fold hydrolase [Dehalococcoidia bacterium]|nr:alpha/beta fold hydrolase [Dehalococcoidia bacterium]
MLNRVIVLEVDGLNIIGQFYLPAGKMPYPTVCVCHGIPAGIPAPNDRGYALLAEQICRQGFAVLIFNFRGTGDSGGNLDILGWIRDLKAAIDYLSALPEVDKSRLWLLGFSGGAAVSICVASQDNRVSSVVSCACPAEFTFFTKADEPQSLIDHFRSIGAIRDDDFPHSAEEWLSGFELVSPIKYVAGIAPRPLLLVHGSKDETVEVSHAYKLYERAGEPKKIIIVDGAEHRLRQNDRAMAIVLDWLKSHAKIGS